MAELWLLWFDESAIEGLDDAGSAEFGATLVQSLELRRPQERVAPPSGAGFLNWNDIPDTVETSVPFLLLWAPGSLSRYPVKGERGEVTEALAFGGTGEARERATSLVTVDADRRPDGVTLGQALVRMAREPHVDSLDVGGTPVQRHCRVSWGEEQVLVWLGGSVLPPVHLKPDERAWLLQALGPRMPRSKPPPEQRRLILTGANMKDQWFDSFVPIAPGGVTALFGRNGAGKTLLLESVASALHRFSHPRTLRETPREPTATLILEAEDQSSTSELFSLILLHLGWSPYDPLGGQVHRRVSSVVPVWSGLDARPAGDDSLLPLDALARPLDELRQAILDAEIATAPWGALAGAAALTQAILNSPAVALRHVEDGLTVGLALQPSSMGHLVDAAHEVLGWLKENGSTPLVDLTEVVYRLARSLATGDERPLIGPMAPLAHLAPLTVHEAAGWGQAGEALVASLMPSMPRPVRFDPWPGVGVPAHETVEARACELLGQFRAATSPDDPRHLFAISPVTARVLEHLAACATGLLPAFVREEFALELEQTDQSQWHKARCSVRLVSESGSSIAVDDAPAGVRTWSYAAIGFAAAQLKAGGWRGNHDFFGAFVWRPGQGRVSFGGAEVHFSMLFEGVDPASLEPDGQAHVPLLYLLDEPEAHLHLSAQGDVVEVAARLSTSGAGALVATHSLAFLNDRNARSTVITVTRRGDKTDLSEPSGLTDLVHRAGDLGVPPSAFAQACRGVLAVEGINDLAMIRQYGGVDLDSHFVLVTVLQGSGGAPNLAELEFLHALGVPIVVLLDHIYRSNLIEALEGTRRAVSGEERYLQALHAALQDQRISAAVLPFAEVDIVCAVPAAEIEWALHQHGAGPFCGWGEMKRQATEAWDRDRTKFKDSFLAVTGVEVNTVLRTLRESGRRGESAQLKGLLAALLEHLDNPEVGAGLKVLNARTPRGRRGPVTE